MEAVKIDAAPKKHYRIQVSNSKKPLFFYVNLAKRYMKQYDDVELSALGTAIPTVVTIAEILKNNGLAIEKRISTSTVGSKDDTKGRLVQKAQIEILLGKTENFEKLTITAVKENFNKLRPTTNTVATVPVVESFNKLTNTTAEAPVTDNSQELTTSAATIEPMTENFNQLTHTAAEAPVTENSQELTTNTAAMEPVNESTNTADEASKKAVEKKF